MRLTLATLLIATVVGALTAPGLAVKPSEWVHETEADFQNAELDQVVVTNLGEVKLSRSAAVVAELPEDSGIVYDLATTDDQTLWIAAGAEGRLMKLATAEDATIETVAEYEGEQIFALAADGDALWVAISGATSRIEQRRGDEVVRTIDLPEARYAWDLVVDGDRLWVATGVQGRVLMLDLAAEGDIEPQVALETTQDNVLCLAFDPKRPAVYAGTDGEGLIYRIQRQPDNDEHPFSTFIVYDAAEPEIGALMVAENGTLYAGTADATQARPGRLEEAVSEQVGAPEPTEIHTDVQEPDDPGVPIDPDPEPQGDADAPADADADAAPAQVPDAVEAMQDSAPANADADAGDADEPAAPTAEQYDTLRAEVRKRLTQAREQGRIDMQVGGDMAGPAAGNRRLTPRRPNGGGSGGARASREGNAVYAIDADGFVREVFRESVMVLRIVEHGDHLLIGTGNEGQIYRVDPTAEETTVIADLESQQIPAMLALDNEVLIGAANVGQLLRLAGGYAATGHFTSDPLDARQISLWGKMRVLAGSPDGTQVSLQTRSGNVGDPDAGSWSDWSQPTAVNPDMVGAPAYVTVDSPPARFLQYRMTLTSGGEATPTVDRIAMSYLVPNLKPRITSVKATYPQPRGQNDAGPQTTLNIEWEAADPNEDQLTYTVEVRPIAGDAPWITLAEDLTETSYEWDTRTISDGRYEIRITADDAADNVPDQRKLARRLSDPVVVDNDQPQWKDVQIQAAVEPGKVTVQATATDTLSRITEIRYSVNGETPWQMILPEDLIYDSTSERVSFNIPDLSPGRHVVALRAMDTLGNTAHVSKTVTVPER